MFNKQLIKSFSQFLLLSLFFTLFSCDSGGGDESGSTGSGTAAATIDPSTFVANAEELAMNALIEADPLQERATMTFDVVLAAAARQKALDMASRRYFDHVDPDGVGPNALVSAYGYTLPGFYGSALSSNNIESLAGGNSTAAATFQQWLDSAGHRAHVLAETSFFQDQVNYGVGYAADPSSPYRYYWVFISAP